VMNNKIKILLIGLALVCAAALVIAFQLNVYSKNLRIEFTQKEQEFQTEKQTLNQQLSSITDAKKKLDVQFSDLRAKFDALGKENDILKNKFDLVTKERASLVEKVTSLADEKKTLEEEVKKLKASGGLVQEPMAGASTSTDDSYWATVLRDKASLEIQAKNLDTQVSDLQLKLSTAMEEGRKIDLQLKTVLDSKRDLERKIIYNEKLSQSLSEDLVREKRDKRAITDQVETLRNENFELKSRLMALGDKKTSLEGKVVDLQQEREILAKRLAELDSVLQERVDQIIEVKNDLKAARSESKKVSTKDSRVVQLQPIVVKAQDEASPVFGEKSGAASGQVLAINEENNFVIVDVGEQDGIKVGQTFAISRNGQNVATVEVIQTRKEISAADIKTVSSGAKIKIGDTVS
jgi:chromosome segregation ATPase